jgi:hypothetical protein
MAESEAMTESEAMAEGEAPAQSEDAAAGATAAECRAAAAHKFQVGDKIANRFTIETVNPPHGPYPRYRATDPESPGHKFILSQIGRPTKESEPDKVKRGLERATRALSWIRHPGFVVPKEFILHEGILFSVFPEVKGVLLNDYVKEQQPPVSKMVHWITEMAAMLEQIHEARQPQYVGNLPIRNVLVNPDGEVQLRGFDINPDLKLEFIPADDTAPKVPEAKIEARSDVWCLGKLLQQMVEAGGDTARKSYKEESDLRALVQIMIQDEPDKRVANMATLKSRLERMSWKGGPKVDKSSQLDAPIVVLTVEEEDKFKAIKMKIKIVVGISVVILLLVMLLGQTLFPEGGGY